MNQDDYEFICSRDDIYELTQTDSLNDLYEKLLDLQEDLKDLQPTPETQEQYEAEPLSEQVFVDTTLLYHIHYPKDSGILSEGYIGVTSNPLARYKDHKRERLKNHFKQGAVMTILEEGSREHISNRESELRPKEYMGWNKATGGLASGGTSGRKLTYKSLDIKENCYRRFKSKYTLYRAQERFDFNYISHFAKEMSLSKSFIREVLRGERHHTKGFTLKNIPIEGFDRINKDFIVPNLITPQGEHLQGYNAQELVKLYPSLSYYALRQLMAGVVGSHEGFRTQDNITPKHFKNITLQNIKTQEIITGKTPKELKHILAPRDVSSLISGVQKTSHGYRLISYEKSYEKH
ncbi:hypothetical protein [Vibrio parahaemolyticus]|uniref:hypothetical protein n=1 Tax=Vibrio parahaemolyticus TaxID=670 RepID=UPI0005F22837|nr:hypothetical protein [Vibrio parahaemolyticus]KJR15248.1 hypothetical protein UF28_16415 [Vibrio parahaemolyticus]